METHKYAIMKSTRTILPSPFLSVHYTKPRKNIIKFIKNTSFYEKLIPYKNTDFVKIYTHYLKYFPYWGYYGKYKEKTFISYVV
jgi:hypothetical protein